ncbi:Pyridoxamine 5'-phosphate oxidase [Actinopolymorpha cephalotaxi]|uniref:General stress protein 26 n=1 Tax=Actinopolymorpha cephalotaxi TaxID=504797 RepID=A0A1I2YJG6_9ACTN|nr:pyridoxamine 5'-phosphate oxidase family protein [Actinopolymorpha cephalotaxi]NYH86939.1 general stress protein 26 [Actinopolymorpha cephalotaxi]SFH25720.1 Pyridoxamine 5'-phosphate oxidase [Actinopolymorpha cephalotaxi]
MALSVNERQEFLAEPHVAALAVDAEDGRGPLVVPIWYQYEPGGEAWVLTGVDSRKARLIEAAGRFSLMVERVQPSVRYVSVEGPVTRTSPMNDEHLDEMARRYLSPEIVEGYIKMSKAEHGEQLVVTMRPERWLSADLGSF